MDNNFGVKVGERVYSTIDCQTVKVNDEGTVVGPSISLPDRIVVKFKLESVNLRADEFKKARPRELITFTRLKAVRASKGECCVARAKVG